MEGWRERLRRDAGHQAASTLAAMHIRAGSLDAALAALERGYEERDPRLVSTINHPQWDPIRFHPRFQALCRQTGLSAEMNAKLLATRSSLRALFAQTH